MSSTPPAAPQSYARTGLKAGGAFFFSVIKGLLLAVLLGGGVFFFYLSQLDGPGMPGARAGGPAAVLLLFMSPTLMIAMILMFFIPLYLMVGMAHGRASALQQVALGHGDTLANSLASVIATRIEAMPRAHGALQKASDFISAEELGRQVAPVLGKGKTTQRAIKFVLKRLPLADITEQWQQRRALQANTEPEPLFGTAVVQDAALRSVLKDRIRETLHDMATPSRTFLYVVLVAHAVVFGLGMWAAN